MSGPVPIEEWLRDPNGAAAEGVLRADDLVNIQMADAIITEVVGPVRLEPSGYLDDPAIHPVCVQGDELPPQLRNQLAYTCPPYLTAGFGALRLVLEASELSVHRLRDRPLLTVGGHFTVFFEVTLPARTGTDTDSNPDPMPLHVGTGFFTRVNTDPYV